MAPPELPAAASGTPAGYGRSCTNCSRAKCKCILRPDALGCERCHRLGKSCQPMNSARKRVAKKSTSSRTAQLEEKLDDLVSILRASQSSSQQQQQQQQQQQPPSTMSYSPAPAFPQCSRLESLATAATSTSPEMDTSIPHSHSHSHSHSYTIPLGPALDTGPSDINETWKLPEPTPTEAEIYLDKFRNWLKNFPFMIIPSEMTAATLRSEKPFLWRCIMNVTSMSVPQQAIMKETIRAQVAQKIVIGHERTMDMLLGLVCYLSWATMNSGPGSKPFLILYVQLAISIIYDMSLTRAPIEEQYFTVCFKVWGGRPPPPKLRTMEERRALLSLWFLTSVITSFIGKLDTLRWTPHMEDCLKVLERDREVPSDEVLVTFIKLQLVGEEAQKFLVRDVMGEPSQAPSYVFKKGMLSRVQEIRDHLGSSIVTNPFLQAHMLATEVQIHSVGLFMQSIPHTQRIESMYSCLKAVRAWYDVFFSISLDELPGSPFSLYIQLSQMQVALYRLTTSEDPAWDKDLVRNTADLLALLDQTMDRFLAVDAHYNLKCDDPEGTLFVKGSKIMKNIRTSWEPALSRHLGGIPTPNSQVMTTQPVEAPNIAESSFLPDHNSIDFNDMTWMTDVFGPWEF